MLVESKNGRGDGEARLTRGHTGDPLSIADRVGQVLIIPLPQAGLVIEEIEL